MKINVGKTDKITRVFLGIALAAFGFYFKSWWGLIALVPLLTALTGFCPLYTLIGVNSNKNNISENE